MAIQLQQHNTILYWLGITLGKYIRQEDMHFKRNRSMCSKIVNDFGFNTQCNLGKGTSI